MTRVVSTDAGPLLETRGLSRHFGGVQAVTDLSITLQPGLIYGLIGPNGAGKSTFINLLSGVVAPSSGAMYLAGRRIDGLRPSVVASLGLARTYQMTRVFGSLTTLENVLVGSHSRRPAGLLGRLVFAPSARAEEQGAREHARRQLERVGLTDQARRYPSDLSYAEQRWLEVARALASRPRLLLLDEPTAGMGAREREQLAALVRDLTAEGLTILLVEHNVPLVMDLCDRIIALDFGRLIAEGTPAQVRHHPAVISSYLGVASA